MKRLTYISRFSRDLSPAEISKIGEISQRNNQRDQITGVLLCFNQIFFQILEGEETKIEKVYEKILVDHRHTDILCLKMENDIPERMFPDWDMKVIILDEDEDLLIQPIKALLKTLIESHRILEKYTQSTILKIISNGVNPLTVSPQKLDRIILFCDIFSFSTIAEHLPGEDVVNLVNQFLSSCTNLITARGGEVTKFMGDCIMAYFDGQEGDAALEASLNILAEMELLRNSAPAKSPLKILYSGIGLARGSVIEGNIGAGVKMDYTVIGDAVNAASRLESLTREFPYFLIFSEEVKESTQSPWQFIHIGEVQAKGKEKPISIYSLHDPVTAKPATEMLRAKIKNYLAGEI